jgi:hypothetical protein
MFYCADQCCNKWFNILPQQLANSVDGKYQIQLPTTACMYHCMHADEKDTDGPVVH